MSILANLPWCLILAALPACGGAPPPSAPTELVARACVALPSTPSDPAWNEAPTFDAPLLLQDMVEPRELQLGVERVRARALCDGARVAFRLEWDDSTRDDELRPGGFSDACAVQLPAQRSVDVPAPQMGEGGKPVEITFWRASWQATVDGRSDALQELYPGAAIDHYPFEAAPLEASADRQREMVALYSPARALGNSMTGPRSTPVQELAASGPGTLAESAPQRADGRGERTASGWAVVIARDLPGGFAPGGASQVAFAVWDGARQEVGARKMRSAWIPFVLEGAQP
jgi:DMSO reductase family type II enzyme heme b subunit